MTHSQAPHATALVSLSPSQPLPGTCSELGIALALTCTQQSPTEATALGDSSCHGGPMVRVQPQALPAPSAAGKLRH